jgi:c-di-GMP-binding flagellar brake protein YcgR
MSRVGIQEREYVRVISARPVLVYYGPDRTPISSYTVDVSGGGFLLAGPDLLAVGDEIDFRLTIATDDPPIEGVGTVIRRDARGRRPVSFVSIRDLDRRRLIRFIFERQRIERRRGLETRDGYGG